MSRIKGDGWFVNERNIIYVQGTVNGKFTRKTTKKKATKRNLAWIEKNAKIVLSKLNVNEATPILIMPSLRDWSYEVLNLTSDTRTDVTTKEYIQKLEKYILPYFKDFQLNEIKALDVEKFQNYLKLSLSSSTVHKYRIILGMILKKAVANDLIPKNPVEYADSVSVVNKETEPYTEDEMQTILFHAKDWLQVFLLLAFTTGMRTGEIMALEWNDIYLEEGYIDLQRGLNVVKSNNKNHNRLIELLPQVIEILSSYQLSCTSSKWLFVSKKGTPYKKSRSINDVYFKPLLEEIGIEYKTLKATRHTFTTFFLNKGISKIWVKKMLGHSASSTVTDKHYFKYIKNIEVLKNADDVFNLRLESVK